MGIHFRWGLNREYTAIKLRKMQKNPPVKMPGSIFFTLRSPPRTEFVPMMRLSTYSILHHNTSLVASRGSPSVIRSIHQPTLPRK